MSTSIHPIHPTSSSNLHNNPFQRFDYGGHSLRVHQLQLQKIGGQHSLLAIIWLSLTLPLFATAIKLWIGCTGWLPVVAGGICTMPSILAAYRFRESNGCWPLVQLLAVGFAVITFSLNAVLQFTSYLFFAVPFALVFAVTMFCCDYRMVTKLFQEIFLGQVVILGLKLDNRVAVSWDIVLFPTFSCYVVLFTCSVLVIVMFLVTLFRGTPEHRYRKHGLGYIVISLCSLSSVLALIFIGFRQQPILSQHTALLISAFFTVLPSLAYFVFKSHILVFFSRHHSISIGGFNQQAQLEKTAGKTELRLKYVSSNYFVVDNVTGQQVSSTNLAQTREKVLCSICMMEEGEMVGMPCGHLSACFDCMDYYIEKNNTSCLLCKGHVNKIYRIEKKDYTVNPQVIQQFNVKIK